MSCPEIFRQREYYSLRIFENTQNLCSMLFELNRYKLKLDSILLISLRPVSIISLEGIIYVKNKYCFADYIN